MKLSVRDEHGFRNVSGEGWQVLLDGEPLMRVTKVDTCAGVAWQVVLDAEGNVMVDRARQEIVERRVFGSFRVVPIQ